MENKKNFWENLTRNQFLYLGIAILIAAILGVFVILKYFWGTYGYQYSVLLFSFGYGLFYFCFRKYQSFSIDQSIDNIDDIKDEPYILYLRSFNDDSETSVPIKSSGMYYTEEEILVSSLEKLGTAVAIGRPGEPAPPLGAKRIYVSDDQWQDKVRQMSADARLVIFRLGETEGLKWEWDYCLDTIEDLSKLLLVVPETMTSEQESMDQLVSKIKKQRNDVQCEELDISQPLEIGSIGMIIYFEKNKDGTFSVKQTHDISDGKTFKVQFAYFGKAFRNIRPETRDYYIGFRINDSLGVNQFIKTKIILEPVFNRFNLSPYNEKLASWMFRIIQAAVYIFVTCLVLMTVLIILGLLGLLK